MIYNATFILNLRQNKKLKKILVWDQASRALSFTFLYINHTFVKKFEKL